MHVRQRTLLLDACLCAPGRCLIFMPSVLLQSIAVLRPFLTFGCSSLHMATRGRARLNCQMVELAAKLAQALLRWGVLGHLLFWQCVCCFLTLQPVRDLALQLFFTYSTLSFLH